jgi:hypothetical protein
MLYEGLKGIMQSVHRLLTANERWLPSAALTTAEVSCELHSQHL